MVDQGFEYIKNSIPDPSNQQLQEFIKYFHSTWMIDGGQHSFPPAIWNHYDTTDSPRTNNHMEGFNRSLNFHVITNKPSIYELILNLKTLEIQITTYYKNRIYNGHTKPHKRETIDIDRDIKIGQLKYRLLHNHITMEQFMKTTAYFFSFEKNKNKVETVLPNKIKNYCSKYYYTDYFSSDIIHPNIQALQH